MAFCGHCGLLLNTNTTTCPRCGTQTDSDIAIPETPPDDSNSATVISHLNSPQPGNISYTPPPQAPKTPPPDATKRGYYSAPQGNNYPRQNVAQSGNLQSIGSYPTPGAFDSGIPQSSNNFPIPGAPYPGGIPQGGYIQPQAPGIYHPATNPEYPFQPQMPPRKTHRGLIAIIIVLIVALVAVTGLLFALGSHQLAGLFGSPNSPIAQSTPTVQPAPTSPPNTATAQPYPTSTQSSSTPSTTAATQQAQATIQQYYTDINDQNYQDAYNLWVSYPDTYAHFKQGFAHTHSDVVTFGDAVAQVDGTIQVNLTLQATEDAASGGTKVTTYQGYYTVGQQADGSWKIINGQLS